MNIKHFTVTINACVFTGTEQYVIMCKWEIVHHDVMIYFHVHSHFMHFVKDLDKK